jgi:hypothetical protein
MEVEIRAADSKAAAPSVLAVRADREAAALSALAVRADLATGDRGGKP